MVNIKRGLTYTCERSDIKVTVLSIMYKNGNFIKAKLAIGHRLDGHYIEIKTFKLDVNLIQHWREL